MEKFLTALEQGDLEMASEYNEKLSGTAEELPPTSVLY